MMLSGLKPKRVSRVPPDVEQAVAAARSHRKARRDSKKPVARITSQRAAARRTGRHTGPPLRGSREASSGQGYVQRREDVDGLSPDLALCLFRVAQEALGNAVRHARAGTIRVEPCGHLRPLNSGLLTMASARTRRARRKGTGRPHSGVLAGYEADAVVNDSEISGLRCPRQFDADRAGTRMADRVGQRFLCHSEQAQRDVGLEGLEIFPFPVEPHLDVWCASTSAQ